MTPTPAELLALATARPGAYTDVEAAAVLRWQPDDARVLARLLGQQGRILPRERIHRTPKAPRSTELREHWQARGAAVLAMLEDGHTTVTAMVAELGGSDPERVAIARRLVRDGIDCLVVLGYVYRPRTLVARLPSGN